MSNGVQSAVAAESPAQRAIEIREGGLPLQLGSQGDLVAYVQRALGIPRTASSARRPTPRCWYQASAGLQVDGIVGLATWGALFESGSAARTSASGTGGSNVPTEVKKRIEQRLVQAGAALEAQGDPGGYSFDDDAGRESEEPSPSGDAGSGRSGSAETESDQSVPSPSRRTPGPAATTARSPAAAPRAAVPQAGAQDGAGQRKLWLLHHRESSQGHPDVALRSRAGAATTAWTSQRRPARRSGRPPAAL